MGAGTYVDGTVATEDDEVEGWEVAFEPDELADKVLLNESDLAVRYVKLMACLLC